MNIFGSYIVVFKKYGFLMMVNGWWMFGEGMFLNVFYGGRYMIWVLKFLLNYVFRDFYFFVFLEIERRVGRWEMLGMRVICIIYIKFCNLDLNKNFMFGFRYLKLVYGFNKELLLIRNGFYLCRLVIWEGL